MRGVLASFMLCMEAKHVLPATCFIALQNGLLFATYSLLLVCMAVDVLLHKKLVKAVPVLALAVAFYCMQQSSVQHHTIQACTHP